MKRLLTVCIFTLLAGTFALAQNADEQALLKLEEDFRAAKINNDVPTLQRVLADNFYEVNWRGEGGNRAVILQIFSASKGRTIELSDLKVHVTGDNAIVRGYQHETRPGMDAYIQFMHFCVKQQGAWKLLAVQQMMDYRQGTRTPHGWNGQSNHLYLIGTDTQIKRSGNASAFLKSKHNERGVGLGLSQQIKADDYRGKRIRLSGYTRGENLGGIGFPWMRVDNAEGVTLSFDNTLNGEAEFDAFSLDWSKFEIVLDVPEQGFIIWMGFQLMGKGHVWLDDWQLEVVSKDVPSTSLTFSEATEKALAKYRAEQPGFFAGQKMRQPKLPTAPVNLDFETPGKQ